MDEQPTDATREHPGDAADGEQPAGTDGDPEAEAATGADPGGAATEVTDAAATDPDPPATEATTAEAPDADAVDADAVDADALDADAPEAPDADSSAGNEPVVETRASRRARREALESRPSLSPMALLARPATVAATVALAALLLLGIVTDPVLLGVALGFTTLVLAWGWPRLLGSSSRFGSSLAIGVTGLLTAAATVITTEQPYLRLVPAALAIGLGFMFGHQIVRRDGRPRLTESIGVTSFGLALVALGSAWMPLSRSARAEDIAVVAIVALGVSVLADLVVGYERARAWMLPLAMVLGGAAGLVAAAVAGGPGSARAGLVGLLVAGVAHALRRALVVLPGIGSLPAQLAAGAASLLVCGVVAYGLALALVG